MGAKWQSFFLFGQQITDKVDGKVFGMSNENQRWRIQNLG
jgi:hypothetical protein